MVLRNGNHVTLWINSDSSDPALRSSIRLTDQLGANSRGIEEIVFDGGGPTWTKADLAARIVAFGGTDQNDTINGTGGADTILAGRGSDVLVGSNGNDTYVYASGDGHDTIDEYSSGSDVDVLHLAGINQAGIQVERPTTDLTDIIIRIVGTGETIRLDNQFDQQDGVEIIRFGDGTEIGGGWTLDGILAGLAVLTGTAAGETITGYTNFNDTISGLGGNDTLRGRTGNDTYLFGRGFGNDLIDDEGGTEAGSADRVLFNAAVAVGDAIFSRVGSDILVRLSDSADTLTVKDGVWAAMNNSTYTVDRVEYFDYADGTRLSLSQIMELAWVRGTNAGETLAGVAWGETLDGGSGADTLNAAGGNDTLIGGSDNDWLVGGSGDDTFLFNLGSGDDVIADFTVHAGTAIGDTIELHDQTASTFAAIMANATETGGNTTINLDDGHSILLNGVTLDQLGQDDFLFV